VTPLLLDAADDPALKERDVRLLLILTRELDATTFAPIKSAALCRRLRIRSRQTLYAALQRLTAAGYLERAPRHPGVTGRYRLPPVEKIRRSHVA